MWAGEGQVSYPDLTDGTWWLKGQQGVTTARRSLKDDVGPCTVIKVESIYCPQQRICEWLR
jgi:hypothetical protein